VVLYSALLSRAEKVCGSLLCTAQKGRDGMWSSSLHYSAGQRRYVVLYSALLSRAEKVCGSLLCTAEQGREGMWLSALHCSAGQRRYVVLCSAQTQQGREDMNLVYLATNKHKTHKTHKCSAHSCGIKVICVTAVMILSIRHSIQFLGGLFVQA